MLFYFGNQFGQASSKLIAYGILHMRGVGGKPGWFWLFALMGAFTVLSGFVFGFFLPDSFKNPTSCFLPNRRLFTDRELHILQTRVLIDDPMKGKKKSHIGLGAFRKAVSTLYHPKEFRLMCLVRIMANVDPPSYQLRQQWSTTSL
jgi:MFS family permease